MSQSKKIVNALSYKIKTDDKFFIDSSLLIPFLDINYDKDEKSKKLSNNVQTFVKHLFDKNAKVYIIPSLISECYNRYSQDLYKPYKEKYSIKQFRKEQKYKDAIESFKIQLKILLDKKLLIFDSYFLSEEEILKYLDSSFFEADINDYIFASYVKQKGLILVTNDKDFINVVGEKTQILSFNETFINKPI